MAPLSTPSWPCRLERFPSPVKWCFTSLARRHLSEHERVGGVMILPGRSSTNVISFYALIIPVPFGSSSFSTILQFDDDDDDDDDNDVDDGGQHRQRRHVTTRCLHLTRNRQPRCWRNDQSSLSTTTNISCHVSIRQGRASIAPISCHR